MEPMYLDYDINDLTIRINSWFNEKGLKDPIMQYAKLNEEVGEIAHELTRGNKDNDEMKDAIGDTFVTLVGMAHHLGLDLSECINMAYQTIRNRKGKVVEGSFVKDDETKNAEPTKIYGFEMRHVEMAKMLLNEGITPHELKEHMHDFEWVADIIRKDFEKQISAAQNGLMKSCASNKRQ